MYFDYDWVKSYLQEAPSLAEAAELLNSTGLETEVERAGLEVEHTVNRPDAMSHYGIARELAVKGDYHLLSPPTYEGELAELNNWTISSQDAAECPQYMGLLLEGTSATKSPAWLKQRLDAIEQTSHNLLVDLTNFLLWEYGHPSHAFDADKIASKSIQVRQGEPGERLTCLDGREHDVAGLLCITDTSRPIALAGVMGGQNSEVDERTTRILLELGVFRAASARRAGVATNIHSDARHRFERGVDRENMNIVLRRFLYLLLAEQPGVRIVGLQNMDLNPYQRTVIQLGRTRLDSLLGIQLPDQEVETLLTRMDCQPERNQEGWQVKVPGYKVEVTREVDMIEELLRFAGLDRIQSTLPALCGSNYLPDLLLLKADKIRDNLCAMGLQETITFGFIKANKDALMGGTTEPVSVRNPMTENQAVMRRNILPSLLNCVQYNQNRGILNLNLFELGHCFDGKHEPHHLAVALTTSKEQNHWWGDAVPHPYYQIKGVYEALALKLGFPEFELLPQIPSWLKSGEALGIWHEQTCLGGLGTLAPALVEEWRLDAPPAVLELDISFLHDLPKTVWNISRFSNFPPMRVDLAFVVDRPVPYRDISEHVTHLNLKHLESCQLFDVYEGKAVGESKKSLGFRFCFRASERTLTSDEVAVAMETVQAAVCKRFGATVRV